jgi:uncharacterized protein YwbE
MHAFLRTLPFLTSRRPPAWRAPGLIGLGAFAVGAGLMYLLDPQSGRRRRQDLMHRGGRLARESAECTEQTIRDLGNRGTGLLAVVARFFRPDDATGSKLAARVRARLGRAVSHPHAIDVSVEDGRVILTGSVLADEIEAAVREAEKVPGVELLENRLQVMPRADESPALQGGSIPSF